MDASLAASRSPEAPSPICCTTAAASARSFTAAKSIPVNTKPSLPATCSKPCSADCGHWPPCERVSVDRRTRLCPQGQNLPGKGLSEPETARHFAPTIRRDQQQRPETRLPPARKPPKTGGFSRDRMKPDLHGTAWWAREDSNLQPSGYEPLALTIELRAPAGFLDYFSAQGIPVSAPDTSRPAPAEICGRNPVAPRKNAAPAIYEAVRLWYALLIRGDASQFQAPRRHATCCPATRS